ncbi:hypothetical protein F4813DRAFT_112012 [Daldinia decipiens]|uniref:uncharacterized protein n=1 Tax=Daldinia decipiens TaxID=326647 RepID=UPI0020C2278B|nr:uncharacterized protein F4813DRAFT_112012 [Daldinia decipiens]KAI1656810.1 hypothetical protein F4813DRAFT_112012 [Daldinia decipiens]
MGWVLALASRRCLLGSIYCVVQHMFGHDQKRTPHRAAYASEDALTCYRIDVIHADPHLYIIKIVGVRYYPSVVAPVAPINQKEMPWESKDLS